jgi:hypothetical protein
MNSETRKIKKVKRKRKDTNLDPEVGQEVEKTDTTPHPPKTLDESRGYLKKDPFQGIVNKDW